MFSKTALCFGTQPDSANPDIPPSSPNAVSVKPHPSENKGWTSLDAQLTAFSTFARPPKPRFILLCGPPFRVPHPHHAPIARKRAGIPKESGPSQAFACFRFSPPSRSKAPRPASWPRPRGPDAQPGRPTAPSRRSAGSSSRCTALRCGTASPRPGCRPRSESCP